MRKIHSQAGRLVSAKCGFADNRGTALIIAVGLLFIFAMLGTAYVAFGYVEIEETNFTLSRARASAIAEAGVNAAIGKLHAALVAGKAVEFGGVEYDFPVYRGNKDPETPALEPLDNRTARAAVNVSDESGKVNLNHAPASVLQRLLNIDGTTARAITASLPQAAAAQAGGGWFTALDDLVDRKLLSEAQFAALDKNLLTVYTVLNHQSPGAYLSINTAPKEVLASVLDLSLEQADHVKAKGPFNSLAALAEAAGKGMETFNIQPDSAGAAGPFLMQPNCFRITSKASYDAMSQGHSVSAFVEAVVLFDSAGNHQIVHWMTTEGTESEAAAAADAEPAAETPEEAGAPEAAEPKGEEAPAPAAEPEAPAPAQESTPETAPVA